MNEFDAYLASRREKDPNYGKSLSTAAQGGWTNTAKPKPAPDISKSSNPGSWINASDLSEAQMADSAAWRIHRGDQGSFLQYRVDATPDAKPTIAAPKNPGGNDSVMDNVADVYAMDSPLMQQAEFRGLAQANRRGLLNSSMGVNAAQDAVLDVAMPIGSQESSQRFGKNLSAQEYRQRKDLMETDIAARRGMQQTDIDFQRDERALDRGLQEQIASWNLSSSDRNAASQMLVNMEGMYQDGYRSVMANPNLSAEARADQLQSIQRLRDAQLDLVEQMYDIDLVWPRSD